MLYERWQKVARDRRNEVALRDLASGQCWTFAQLSRAAETTLPGKPAMVCPQGHSAEFIFAVLRAWRCDAVVCPIEPHDQPPSVPPENIVATMGLRPDWPNLAVISLAHSYGFSNLVLPLLLQGIPLILAPSPLPEAVRRAAEGHPHLTLAGVPALWRAWHGVAAIPGNVRLAISAGAPLPVTLERTVFDTTGLKIHNFYGSSECGGIAYDAMTTPRADGACAGRPMQNVEVGLNQDGTLLVQSRAVGETYWPKPADTLGRGRFQTSDLAELKEGAVYLIGRAGDQINVAGRKVSPTTIEQALRQHEAVAECLVFGVPNGNADRTDLIVACVTANRHSTAKELKQFLLQKLSSWQVPREWWFVKSLDANARGKVSRAEWRGEFLKMRAQGTAKV
jgi:acyl-CoA synthetase (AMP-forming)/AMP-acid ligase II